MNQVKIGKFIASLRRGANLTQEALGEKLGVTNKTVSRWENGNYMPDIEMLTLLSKEFGVSINELLAGERLSDEEFRAKADENIAEVAKSNTFSRAERISFLKRKWRREHIALLAAFGFILAAAVILPIVLDKPWLGWLSPIIAFTEYAYQNNRMMTYVEAHAYDGKE